MGRDIQRKIWGSPSGLQGTHQSSQDSMTWTRSLWGAGCPQHSLEKSKDKYRCPVYRLMETIGTDWELTV